MKQCPNCSTTLDLIYETDYEREDIYYCENSGHITSRFWKEHKNII